MANLFEESSEQESSQQPPLADQVRPEDFDGFYGQDELVGETPGNQ